jgi:hypothetical protein
VARRVIGIDFSGAADQWKPKRKNSNVWLAFGAADGPRLVIDELKPVQALEGEGDPFDRLVGLLAASDAVVGIDASFSVPTDFVADPAQLWATVAALPTAGRPFAKGEQLVELLTPDAGKHGTKVYRLCEEQWVKRGLNVRSNLWCGPRGGAAFTVACMTLLHRHTGPVWPLRPGGDGALLAEAYPAAQLKTWGLDPLRYNGATAAARKARWTIVEALVRDRGLRASDEAFETCIDNADALDAVICAFGARALAGGRHPRRLPSVARTEGWVIIDEGAAPAPAVERRAEPRQEEEGLVDGVTQQIVQRLFDRAFEAVGR